MSYRIKLQYWIKGTLIIAIMVSVLCQLGSAQAAPRDIYFLPIVWSHDGSKLAITLPTESGSVEVRDANTRQLIYVLSGHSAKINSVAWSPGDSMLATGSNDQTIKLWQASDGSLLKTLTGQNDYVSFVSWTPDGSYLVSSGMDVAPVFVKWDPETGQPIDRYKTGTVLHGAFSPDKRRFAYAAGGSLDIRDAATFERTALHRAYGCCDNVMVVVKWSHDSSTLISGAGNGLVTIWDAVTATIKKQFLVNSYAKKNAADVPASDVALTWVRDAYLDVDGKTAWAVAGDGSIKAWNIDTGKIVQQSQLPSLATASWSPYGARLALLDDSFLPSVNGQLSSKHSAEDGLQIIVIDPSFKHLHALAEQCVKEGHQANQNVQQLMTSSITNSNLAQFVQEVELLPVNAIPPACKGDLLALAMALKQQ